MRIAILVPVKHPERAKRRLAPLLGRRERALLAAAMLEDLAAVLTPLRERAPIVAVTSSRATAVRVAALGWRVMPERRQTSESASVDAASRELAAEGFAAVLRLPADLPLVETADVEALLGSCPEAPGAALVPSRDGTGTNALLRHPPDLFPSRFGPDSLRLHLAEGRRVGADLRVIRNPRLALDVDEPADLAELVRVGREGATLRALRRLGILEGLTAHAR